MSSQYSRMSWAARAEMKRVSPKGYASIKADHDQTVNKIMNQMSIAKTHAEWRAAQEALAALETPPSGGGDAA